MGLYWVIAVSDNHTVKLTIALLWVFVSVQVQKILQSSQQKEGQELKALLTNPHLQVRDPYVGWDLSYLPPLTPQCDLCNTSEATEH